MFRNLIQSVFGMAVCIVLCCGCDNSPAPEFRLNAVEVLKQEKAALSEGEHFDPAYKKEIGNILTALFGTPDEPQFPFLLGEDDDAHEFISMDNIKWAAGRVHSDQDGKPITGIYREHCAHCHGISGDGAGPTAAFLNPYPRDFRLGKFKFKASPLRQMPADKDLKKILVNGIPGTAMPSFRTLPAEELDALIDYVKYLTIRGMYERFLIAEVADLEDEPLLNMDVYAAIAKLRGEEGDDDDEESEEEEEFLDQMDYLFSEGLIDNNLSLWVDTEDGITEVPEIPGAIATDHPDHKELVDRGRELFYAKGNCAQCHGENAAGDGQTNTFDDWTNDWIKTAGVDPTDRKSYRDFSALGALKPRPIRPRNLQLPVYRGGGHPGDLYVRILNGIEGTPMPSGATLTEEEIWALVAYVKAIPFEGDDAAPAKKVNEKAIAR